MQNFIPNNLLGSGIYNNIYNPFRFFQRKPEPAPAPFQPSPMFANPFSTAMSGTQSGTLQPYINRNTQLANNALYGGLLNSPPAQLLAGDAGGTPVNPTPPQFNLPSALPHKPMFGNRAWMEY